MKDTQLHWMQHKLKKPKSMSPRDFHWKEILAVSLKLSGRFQTPNDHEKKTWLFNAYLSSYQQKYQKAGKAIEGLTMDEIVNYFQTLHDYEVKQGHLNENRQKKRGRDVADGESRSSNKKQRGRDKHNGRRGGRNDKGRTEKNGGWHDPCQLHPYASHTWGKCTCN